MARISQFVSLLSQIMAAMAETMSIISPNLVGLWLLYVCVCVCRPFYFDWSKCTMSGAWFSGHGEVSPDLHDNLDTISAYWSRYSIQRKWSTMLWKILIFEIWRICPNGLHWFRGIQVVYSKYIIWFYINIQMYPHVTNVREKNGRTISELSMHFLTFLKRAELFLKKGTAWICRWCKRCRYISAKSREERKKQRGERRKENEKFDMISGSVYDDWKWDWNDVCVRCGFLLQIHFPDKISQWSQNVMAIVDVEIKKSNWKFP